MSQDYGAHSFDQPPPGQDLQRRAIAATSAHPLHQEAATYVYCQPTVMHEPKSFLARSKSPAIQQLLSTRLQEVDRVVLVSYATSPVMPEPLAGGGKSYDFILHPDTMEVLHVSTGTWRS